MLVVKPETHRREVGGVLVVKPETHRREVGGVILPLGNRTRNTVIVTMDTDSPAPTTHSIGSSSMAQAVHATLRFARVLRYRISYVVVATVVSCVLGALYYTTSTRLYEARASLLVIPNGTDLWNPAASVDGSRQALIPTYVHLFYEDVVLDRAVEYLASQPEAQTDFRGLPQDKWAEVLRKNLTAERERRTNLILIAYRSRSPRAAEAVVAAVDRAYLDFIDKNHRDLSADLVRALDQERTDIEKRLQAKHLELLQAKRNSGDLGLKDGSQAVHPIVQRVLSLNDKLIAVQQSELEMKATLAAVYKAVQAGGDLRQHLVAVEPMVGRELLMSGLGLSPQNTEVLSKVEQKLMDDRARLEKLLKHYGEAYPDVIQSRHVIAEGERYLVDYQRNVQQRLNRMTNNQLGPLLIAMLDEKLEKLQAHERELSQQYELCESQAIELNDRLVQASIIENEVERLRHLHDTLLNRMAGIDINESQADVRVTVVSDPVAGNSPVSPRLLLTALLCLVGGIAAGFATVYVLDLLDDRFQSPDEIIQQTASPLLGIIQALPASDHLGLESVRVFSHPGSVESESFRTLRTAIVFSGRELDSLAMTSAEPGDGKTTVLVNLGVTYALSGKRTLLIDADMRRPGLSRLLDVRGISGLSKVLQTEAAMASVAEQAVRSTALKNLYVLPSGSRPGDPSELLSGTRFAELLAWASAQYDQVLVDCPPVMAASDAAIVGRQTDGTLLVLQPEKNHRRLVLRAVQSLSAMQVTLIGTVANRVGQQSGGAFLSQIYGYETYEDHSQEEEEPALLPVRRRAA